MKLLLAASLLMALCSAQAEDFGVRLVLGVADSASTTWDGSVEARGARITSLEPWRFEGSDAIVNGNAWRCSTHEIRLFGGQALVPRPVVGNGVVVWLTLASETSSLEVKTAQGSFTVPVSSIPFGKSIHLLDGRVMADRVPVATAVASSPDEQDMPAAAATASGDIWLAYLQFQHSPDHNRLRANMQRPPSDFDQYTLPTGGDQIVARRFSGGQWMEPVQITPAGGDVYRPAVAVDGKGRAWVFWSSNTPVSGNANFDLWARAVDNNKAGPAVRLSSAPGSDIDPSATTDAQGRVWVSWQGWREGRAMIFAAVQSGDGFSPAVTISASKANEWNPSIAADGKGRVTVAYESYRNGNYDIFYRTYSGSAWGKEAVGAASPRYEAYPSIAYERSGRLWLAYEEGAERWGKDMGADESSGVALYQGRAIKLRGWEPDGRTVEATVDVGTVLPGVASPRVDSMARQSESQGWHTPQADRWKKRDASRATPNYVAPRNTSPRLHVDGSGRLWLAARSNHPIWWNPLGTVWHEYVVSYDGDRWTGPVYLAHSDNLLDNRPALVSTAPGQLTVLGSSDARHHFHLANVPAIGGIVNDPYNNDIFTNRLSLPPGSGKLATREAAAPSSSGIAAEDAAELAGVTAMRAARINQKYQVVRGEFHRHSEISMDGGNDGSILEQWRYMLDAAHMDWVGCCDHDNGGGREYSWWITQKQTDIFYTPGRFVPLFSYERSVQYPEGHRNVVFSQRGVRPLPRIPISKPEQAVRAPDTQMFYAYLKKFNGIVASHTSGTNMGTDWRDNDPLVEPVVEIYQGERQNYEMPGAPRTNKEADSIGGWRPKGFVNLALEMGYKLAFQASSDHISTHMSYCNVLAADKTRESVLEGFQKRHVYGATDNILAEFGSGSYIMGDAFQTNVPPELYVKLSGTAPFAKVHLIKDNQYVYTTQPGKAKVEFRWRDASPVAGKTSYYYVRGEQADGEVVWVSPMWITYNGK
ncbi:MAG: hypothetical protein JJE04_07595 [Acidobacteriia bacterium]|nr:hypothetical protein [Terriglobia bacterium]